MKRREFIKLSAVAGTGAVLGATMYPYRSFGASQKPLKIGLLTPFSGVLTDYGVRLDQGARLAVEVVNEAGGIL